LDDMPYAEGTRGGQRRLVGRTGADPAQHRSRVRHEGEPQSPRPAASSRPGSGIRTVDPALRLVHGVSHSLGCSAPRMRAVPESHAPKPGLDTRRLRVLSGTAELAALLGRAT